MGVAALVSATLARLHRPRRGGAAPPSRFAFVHVFLGEPPSIDDGGSHGREGARWDLARVLPSVSRDGPHQTGLEPDAAHIPERLYATTAPQTDALPAPDREALLRQGDVAPLAPLVLAEVDHLRRDELSRVVVNEEGGALPHDQIGLEGRAYSREQKGRLGSVPRHDTPVRGNGVVREERHHR